MRAIVASLVVCALALHATPAGAQTIVINELVTGADDWFEIANLGGSAKDISGWCLVSLHAADPTPQVFLFPGAAGTGTVSIAANECIVVSESATTPAVALGVQRFTTTPSGAGFYPFVAGASGSAVLTDAQGNGVDYFAWGTPNTFAAPFEAGSLLGYPGGGAQSTAWIGAACPAFSGSGVPSTSDVHFRHGRSDGNDAYDWSNFGAASASGTQTPGALNRFQRVAGVAASPAVASFSPSLTFGFSPLTVRFTNTSTGGAELSLELWDFDSLTNPGTHLSAEHDPQYTFAAPTNASFRVSLTIVDVNGNASSAPMQTVTIYALPPLAPVASVPFFERFEGPLGPDGTSASPSVGWQARLVSPSSRVRTASPFTLSGTFPSYVNASASSGPTVAILDSSSGLRATVELILHIDLAAIGGACRVRYRIFENADETDPEDVIVFQDGTTAGQGVAQGGGSTGSPGTNGFKETLLNDWNLTLPAIRTWKAYEHTIDSAFLAANGMVAAADARLIFRQADNGDYEGGDGLLIDDVQVLAPLAQGPGQACQLGAAVLDVSAAMNANQNPVGTPGDLWGPFFTTIGSGGPVVLRFEGTPLAAVVLMAGILNPGAATFGVLGKLDLGTTNPTAPFIPHDLAILVDGTRPGFLESFFRIGVSGSQTLAFGTTTLPPGTVLPLQAAITNPTTIVRLSNAVQITVY
jgi:PKD repeat protein